MKYLYKTLLFFTTILSLIDCNTSSDTDKVTLKVDNEQLTFFLDSTTANYTIPDGCGYIKLNKKKESLFYFSRLTNTLLFFDINSKKVIQRIQYLKQGIFPISDIIGIEVISQDSIFILPSYIKKLYLNDWNGRMKKVYNLQNSTTIENTWQNEPFNALDISYKTAIFETIPIGDQNKPNNFFKVHLGATINLENEKMKINFIKYPDIYQHGEKWGLYHTMASQCINNKDEIIISFPLDPKLYIYDKNLRLIRTPIASSSHFLNRVIPFVDSDDTETYCYNQDKYEQIAYDKYRNIYYRFATKGIEGKPPTGSNLLYKGLFKPLYVVILDKNFRKIGEVELPDNKHYFMNYFISERGLFISNSHPHNRDNNENQLSFTCYKVFSII